ncbi:MAG: hypothetical protein RLZZ77_1860 [Bacteroidota bacterium]
MDTPVCAYVDFLFIGLGASNSLLMLKMHEIGLLDGKKIAVIEPNLEVLNDRNFCFWATEEELLQLNLQGLISSRWQNMEVAGRTSQSIAPVFYYHIRGADLSRSTKEILTNYTVQYFSEKWESEPVRKDESYIVDLSSASIEAKRVFDSRPPQFKKTGENQSHLLQSFYGWEVEVREEHFEPSKMVMMDFAIPQDHFCQFIYILPFTANKALIEVTRFGKEVLTTEAAQKILLTYLEKLEGTYEVVNEERGVIPMSSYETEHADFGIMWTRTGVNADLIKPTTGYAFFNMAKDADLITASILEQTEIKREGRKSRFEFYDHLLLKILEKSPEKGKRVFHSLFSRVPLNEVLVFLSEKSTLRKEVKIFSKLPKLLFVKTAIAHLWNRLQMLSPVHLALVMTLLALLLNGLNIQMPIWMFLSLGFLWVGLPHGALDHLTDQSLRKVSDYARFILKYLMKGAILGLLWLVLPDWALLIFILFSAWHFGQGDFKEWNLAPGWRSFLWGVQVLTIILFFHHKETSHVLAQVNGSVVHLWFNQITDEQLTLVHWTLVLSSFLFAGFMRSRLIFLSLLYLFLSAYLPLLFSFGIYFIVQHSWHGWRHLKHDLQVSSYQLWLKSLPFTLGGLLLFFAFILLNTTESIGVFFIVLSCISIPHIFSMHLFYKTYSEGSK